DRRHDDTFHQRSNDFSKSNANDYCDGEVNYVGASDEFFEFFQHWDSSFCGILVCEWALSKRSQTQVCATHWHSLASLYPAFSASSLSLNATRFGPGTPSPASQSDK